MLAEPPDQTLALHRVFQEPRFTGHQHQAKRSNQAPHQDSILVQRRRSQTHKKQLKHLFVKDLKKRLTTGGDLKSLQATANRFTATINQIYR